MSLEGGMVDLTAIFLADDLEVFVAVEVMGLRPRVVIRRDLFAVSGASMSWSVLVSLLVELGMVDMFSFYQGCGLDRRGGAYWWVEP
jgi:hypothetical protein